jgi:hypothetical protein
MIFFWFSTVLFMCRCGHSKKLIKHWKRNFHRSNLNNKFLMINQILFLEYLFTHIPDYYFAIDDFWFSTQSFSMPESFHLWSDPGFIRHLVWNIEIDYQRCVTQHFHRCDFRPSSSGFRSKIFTSWFWFNAKIYNWFVRLITSTILQREIILSIALKRKIMNLIPAKLYSSTFMWNTINMIQIFRYWR